MEKKINSKALLASLAFALICCVLLLSYVNGIKRPVPEVEKIKLLVALRNIEPGIQLTKSDINAIDISADSMPDGVINNREEIEGMYAGEPIMAGEPFRGERLFKKEDLSLSWNIPDSMRAISIFVNEDAIFSTQLRIGDRVDVIGSFKSDVGEGRTIASSMIIVQNAEVLAIGSDRLGVADSEQSGSAEKLPATVTLALSPADSEKIVYAIDFGDFSLILRGKDDTVETYTPGILIEDVIPARLKSLQSISNKDQTGN